MAEIGKVATKKGKRIHVYEDTHAEWRIPEFFSISEYHSDSTCYHSPTFSVAGVPFFFKLYPRSFIHPDGLSFYIKSGISRDFSVEYNYGLKKVDGSVKQLYGGTMKGNETWCIVSAVVLMSELQLKKSELVPGNVLTLTCTLRPETAHSTEKTQFDNPKASKLIKLDKLSQNFKDLFGNKETCDVTLKVKDKEYKAHRSILIARSSVFAATFKHDTLEKQTGIITISDCDPDCFLEFLDYLYCGKLEGISFQSALNLYYTSDKYDVEDLKTFCLEYLMQSLTVENICEVVVFADKYEDAALFSAIQDFFNRNVGDILVTSEWDDLLATNRRLANKLLIEMPKVKYED